MHCVVTGVEEGQPVEQDLPLRGEREPEDRLGDTCFPLPDSPTIATVSPACTLNDVGCTARARIFLNHKPGTR